MSRIYFPFLLLFCLIATGPTSAKPAPAITFTGTQLPVPPAQHQPWPHSNTPLFKTIDSLFALGLADPRGCEYREVTVTIGKSNESLAVTFKQTHAWVMPPGTDGKTYAVTWSGLVYPVARVGNKADLKADVAELLQRQARGAVEDQLRWSSPIEENNLDWLFRSPLHPVLLWRLGENSLASQLWRAGHYEVSAAYYDVADAWIRALYERTIGAFARGDDWLMRADTRLLASAVPVAEAELRHLGVQPSESSSVHPYFGYLDSLSDLRHEAERRTQLDKHPKWLRIQQSIADLDKVRAPVIYSEGPPWPYKDKYFKRIIAQGDAAVEPLLEAMAQDNRLTRTVISRSDFRFSPEYIFYSVADAAADALQSILHVEFAQLNYGGHSQKWQMNQLRMYWNKYHQYPMAERWYRCLLDDQASLDLWQQSARLATYSGSLATYPPVPFNFSGFDPPKSGAKLLGEPLRRHTNPSFTQLLIRRSNELLRRDDFEGSTDLALNLAMWDHRAAPPILYSRLQRGVQLEARSRPEERSSGDGLGSSADELASAMVWNGDSRVWPLYAHRLRLVALHEMPEPLNGLVIKGVRYRVMQDAINWLFNDPRSQWYNLMDPQTGEMEVGSFDTVLSRTQAFQRHILRNLANRRQMRVPASSSLSGNFVFGDDDAEHPNRAKVIRICDRYVLALHNYSHGPAISLDWPLVRRNQAVRACRQWVLRGGLKPRRKSACPRSRGYFSNEGRLQSVKLRKPGPGNLNPAPLAGNTLVRPPGG